MKRANLVVSCIATIILLGFQVGKADQNSPPILENAVTLELSFAAVDFPESYLIGYPARVTVADNGDMVLSNNGNLIVYDSNGNKKLETGQKFPYPKRNLILSPDIVETGYITVADPIMSGSYNLYDSEYNFIENVKFWTSVTGNKILEEQGWNGFNSANIFGFKPGESFWDLRGSNIDGEQSSGLFYENESDLKTIYILKKTTGAISGAGGSLMKYGVIYNDFLPNRRLVYIQTGEHRFNDNGNWYYELQIADLRSDEEQTIQVPYKPVAIPDAIIRKDARLSPGMSERLKNYRISQNELRRRQLIEIGFYPSIQKLITDRNFIFSFTYEYKQEQGYLADVIDSNTGTVISKTYFSVIPQIIRNGYAYRTIRPKTRRGGPEGELANGGDSPIVEKYKIDLAAYGK